jgi:hypothetical protein
LIPRTAAAELREYRQTQIRPKDKS